MGSLMSVSKVNGVLPDTAFANMDSANEALADQSLQAPSGCAPRVQLDDIPSGAAPVLAFTLRDGMWRLAKARGAQGPAIKTTGRVALDCSVCWSSSMTQASTHGTHPILAHALAVRVPCCAGCEQLAQQCTSLGTECMSCLKSDSDCMVERADTHASAQLCRRCADSKWCQTMMAAVGSVIDELPDITQSSSSSLPSPIITTEKKHKKNAKPAAKKTTAAAAAAAEPKANPRTRTQDAMASEGGCAECSTTETTVTCGRDDCTRSLCGQCLRQQQGVMAALYERQRGLWVCPMHG